MKNIEAADKVASTSWLMKAQTEVLKNPKQPIAVTPFGIDCAVFAPLEKSPRELLRIGTVKIFHSKYGIDTLIEAFAIAVDKGLTNAELVLVGDGPEKENLKRLARRRAVSGFVQFPGWVPHASVPTWLNSFDIYCALSRSDGESFGVAILEASACGLPVLVSDAGGLPEVVRDGETGCVVPRDDPVAAAERILELAHRPDLRTEMGQRGRRHVLESYRWEECADRMEELYRETIANYRSEQRLVAAS